MSTVIKIELNEKLFLRDPEQSSLGKSILTNSIRLIDELGFEQFTFKKLAAEINSTEASVYRYFENKHKLLIYLISWYWAWLDYQIDYHTNNINDARERLRIAIRILAESYKHCSSTAFLDSKALHGIVVADSSKAYFTKWVDKDNKEGFFKNYKALCHKIALMIAEINPAYPYSHALVSMVIESAHQQVFFAEHLPSLTEAKVKAGDYSQIYSFLEDTVMKAISC